MSATSHDAPARTSRFVISLLLAAVLAAALSPAPARGMPSTSTTPVPEPSVTLPPSYLPSLPSTASVELDEATRRALRLQDAIESAEADEVALQQRIQVVNVRILRQQNVLDDARIDVDTSRARFEERLVTMYKTGLANPFMLLLSAKSLADFYARAVMLARVLAQDARVFREAEAASARADSEASALDDLKAQLVVLRSLHDRRLEDLKFNLGQQKLLVATLSARSREIVSERKAAFERSRKEWRESSIPVDTPIAFAAATVESVAGEYLVAEYQPRQYVARGEGFSAVCSWYGNEFNGRPTASGQIFNQDDLTCASRTLAFGTRIALTRAGRRIIVVVNDRGPFIAGRDLDLSRAAARALGFSGVETVSAIFVDPVGEASAAAAAR